ncbi:MAG TPA: hypothetical protein VHM02_01120, partial [Thermoanaerobaculia bacterium]|nr:hypothetical protein [Thermoanaerobaculia bacterium]
MDDETTLRTAAEATMAARRDALGEAPSPEELIALRDGSLPPEGRGLVEEKVAAFPEAAATLLDLARFPDVPAAPGVREVGDDEIARDWQRLRARMTRERRAEDAAPAASRPRWRSAALLAAGLFVGVIGGVLVARGPLAPPPAPTP